eukprot:3104338-Amphidinium_carterae.1
MPLLSVLPLPPPPPPPPPPPSFAHRRGLEECRALRLKLPPAPRQPPERSPPGTSLALLLLPVARGGPSGRPPPP